MDEAGRENKGRVGVIDGDKRKRWVVSKESFGSGSVVMI